MIEVLAHHLFVLFDFKERMSVKVIFLYFAFDVSTELPSGNSLE